jgi:hypothetical protein
MRRERGDPTRTMRPLNAMRRERGDPTRTMRPLNAMRRERTDADHKSSNSVLPADAFLLWRRRRRRRRRRRPMNQKTIRGVLLSVVENRRIATAKSKHTHHGASTPEATPRLYKYKCDCASPTPRRYIFQRDTYPLCR